MALHPSPSPPLWRRFLSRLLPSKRTLPSLLAVLSIAAFLTFHLALQSPPTHTPTRSKIGWQKWDAIWLEDAQAGGEGEGFWEGGKTVPVNGSEGLEHGQGEEENFVEAPLDIWNPILPHRTPLTAITIKSCRIPPTPYFDICMPKSTPADDARLGKWVRVGADLNMQGGLAWLYAYYRRSRRYDAPPIVDLRIVLDDDKEALAGLTPKEEWHKAGEGLRTGLRHSPPPASLYYRLAPSTSSSTSSSDYPEPITELDVLYGPGPAWPSFSRVEGENAHDAVKGKSEAVALTYRKGYTAPAPAPPLEFGRDGKFRILQVADLHFSVGNSACRDTDKAPCDGDRETIRLMEDALDALKPGLVVFSGDQLNGQKTSWDTVSVASKFTRPVVERKIPFAVILGNHDSEYTDMIRREQMKLLSALPYSLAEVGPAEVDGAGNYVVRVRSPDASKTPLLTLYFIDTHDYAPRQWLSWGSEREYDWIKPSQAAWFLEQSARTHAIERPFTPDGAEDLKSPWARVRGRGREEERQEKEREGKKVLAKPNAMLWGHIPMREYYDSPADKNSSGLPLEGWGSALDLDGAPKKNSGFWDALRSAREEWTEQGEGEAVPEVRIVAHGHCHITDNCKRVDGIWICFDGGSSFSGYSQLGFHKRFRVFDISQFGERIETWKRTESGEEKDRVVLVEGLGG